MKKLLVLLVAICAISALAENQVLYTLDFEDYPAGSVFGYDGWEKFYGTQIDAVVDSTVAHTGEVCLFTDGANSFKNDIDISDDYQEGTELLISYGREIAHFTAGQLPVQARSAQVYELPCTATLMDRVSLLDLLAIASKRSLEGMTVDVKLRVSLKGGKGTTLTFNGLDLAQFSE